MATRNFALTLLFVFLTALLLRLVYFIVVDYDLSATPDTSMYIEIANGILQTGEYVSVDESGVIGSASERVPVYPLFIAINQTLFGDNYLISTVIAQIILDSFTCVMIVLIASNINKAIVWPAAILSITSINMIFHSALVLTDSLFLMFFTSLIYVTLLFYENRRIREVFYIALFLSLGIMTKPMLYFFAPVVILSILYVLFVKVPHIRTKVIGVIVLFSVLFGSVGSFLSYNYSAYGYFGLVSQEGNAAMSWYVPLSYQFSLGDDRAITLERVDAKYEKKLKETLNQQSLKNPFYLSEIRLDIAKKEMLNLGFVNTIKAWFSGAIINVLAPSLSSNPVIVDMERPRFYDAKGDNFIDKSINFLFHEDNRIYMILMIPAILLTIIFRFFALAGLISAIKSPEYDIKKIAILFAYMTYILAITGPIVGAARYRLPIEPILIIFSSIAFSRILSKYNKS